MATIYDKVKEKLENFPDFRERRFRRNKLAVLALRDLGLYEKYKTNDKDSFLLDLEELADFASKYDSYRHEYDAVQKDCEHLQGTDYADGKILAQEKMLEFGYEVGYNSDIRKLKTL